MLFQVEGWSAETQELLIINYIKRDTGPLKKHGNVSMHMGTLISKRVFAKIKDFRYQDWRQSFKQIALNRAKENKFMTLILGFNRDVCKLSVMMWL